jgi:hypothetical protein
MKLCWMFMYVYEHLGLGVNRMMHTTGDMPSWEH